MKKILLALAFIGCMFAAHAQEKPSTGDLYDGLTRPLTFNRVIPPYALEVTFIVFFCQTVCFPMCFL